MVETGKRQRRLSDGYSFAGFRARATVRGVFGDPNVRIVRLDRRSKKRFGLLRTGPDGLVRPAGAAGSRLAERRISDCSGTRSAARRVPPLRRREARTAGLSGGQSAL